MKSNIGENIKFYRKEKGFTQEQLAEAMGVSVGAVSKWESGASVPELSLILELADFFGTSVDSLLGYKVRNNSAAETAERLRIMRSQKDYTNAFSEVEKAVQKFPNNFDVVYQSGGLLYFFGLEKNDKKAILKSKELLEHALTLIDQPHAHNIGKSDIYDDLSGICFILEEDEKGLDMLKDHNEGGIFNAEIGYELATSFGRHKEAIPYLSDSLILHITDLFKTMIGFANVFENRNEPEKSIEALLIAKNIDEMFRVPGTVSYLDKGAIVLITFCAQSSEVLGDENGIRKYLSEAKKVAENFDKAPDYTAKNIKYYEKDIPASAADDFGKTAMDGIDFVIESGKKRYPKTFEIWQEMKENG